MYYKGFFFFKEWFAHSFFLVNRLGRSPKMSNHEPFAHVAQRKCAIVSEWHRLLTKNEWITRCFEQIAHSLIFGQKTSDSLGKPMSEVPALVLVSQESTFFDKLAHQKLNKKWLSTVCWNRAHIFFTKFNILLSAKIKFMPAKLRVVLAPSLTPLSVSHFWIFSFFFFFEKSTYGP